MRSINSQSGAAHLVPVVILQLGEEYELPARDEALQTVIEFGRTSQLLNQHLQVKKTKFKITKQF